MRPLARAFGFGIGGYLIGALLGSLLSGDRLSDEVSLVFGFLFGLIGWLLGIGVWGTWIREWLGLTPRDEEVSGWRRYFRFTTDHKVIGIQYGVTFVTVLLLAGLIALALRLELASPGQDFIDADAFNKVMSMHGILMIAVAVAGILGTFGNYLVPLMIGADDMAFPRVNAVSFWLIPPVALALLTAPLIGSFDAGWTAYPPLSVVNESGQVLFILGVVAFGLSSILGGLNILTTVITMRAPGMTWGRLPIFVWAAVSASVLSLLVTQFFAASLVMILTDRVAGTSFFDAAAGGDALLYEHTFWFYSHPAVYIMVLPAFGLVLEVTAHMARKPLFAYRAVVASLFAIVGLSAVVWAHHMFVSGMADFLHAPFMVLTELISIPTGVIFLAFVGTIWEGRLRFKTPLLLAFGWAFNFLIGGLTGIFLADVATDVHLHDTYFVVAHFHYTIVGGSIFALLTGLYFWFPKMVGRMYHERQGQVFAIWLTVGLNVTFIPMFWLGINGMNRRIADYPDFYADLNLFASIAAFFMGGAFVLFVINMLGSLFRGRKAPRNPWGATTLEWQLSSPPPRHNFPQLPEVIGSPYTYGTDEKHVLIEAGKGGER